MMFPTPVISALPEMLVPLSNYFITFYSFDVPTYLGT